MKITGTSNECEHLIDRVEPGAAVGELDVGEDDAGPLGFGERHGLAMGARDAEHAMAKTFDQRLEIERDEGLVLDDQHVGGDLGGELAAGFLDQRAQPRHVDVEHLGGVVFGEAFQRHQQERLARHGRDLRKMPLDRLARRLRRPTAWPLSGTEFQILVNSR